MEKRKHSWSHCTVATTLFRGPPSSSLWFWCNSKFHTCAFLLSSLIDTHCPYSSVVNTHSLASLRCSSKGCPFLLCFAYVFSSEGGFFCFVFCKILMDWSFWPSVSICCCLCAFLERAFLDLIFFLPLSFPVEVLADLYCWVLVRWRDRDRQTETKSIGCVVPSSLVLVVLNAATIWRSQSQWRWIISRLRTMLPFPRRRLTSCARFCRPMWTIRVQWKPSWTIAAVVFTRLSDKDTGGHLQQMCLPGRDLGFRTRAKYTPDLTFLTDTLIVCASDASERLGLKLHGGKKKEKEQKLDYHHVGWFEFPQCWFLVTLYYCRESWRFQNCTWMRILSWCMGTRVVDLFILLMRSSWMIIISWTNPHCSERRVFFQIHLKLGQSHSPPFVYMQTQMWWFATEFETQMFHWPSSSQFVVGWSSLWWIPAPSLSLGFFFAQASAFSVLFIILQCFAATLDYLLKVASWTTTNNMLSSEQILKGGCDQLVCDQSLSQRLPNQLPDIGGCIFVETKDSVLPFWVWLHSPSSCHQACITRTDRHTPGTATSVFCGLCHAWWVSCESLWWL